MATRPTILINSKNIEDVIFTSITSISLKKGYAELEVDDFLDKVAETLKYYEDLVWEQAINQSQNYKQDLGASNPPSASDV